MAEGEPGSPSPFDVRTIKYLVSLMSRHDLTEIDLREGALRIRLRRGPKGGTMELAPSALPSPPPLAQAPASPQEPPPTKLLLEIKSPTPGTFYSAASPEAEPYVQVGSKVQPSTVVCLIEAMKVFNEITADCTGTIAAVLVENQQPVEYGQVLFRVDPSG